MFKALDNTTILIPFEMLSDWINLEKLNQQEENKDCFFDISFIEIDPQNKVLKVLCNTYRPIIN